MNVVADAQAATLNLKQHNKNSRIERKNPGTENQGAIKPGPNSDFVLLHVKNLKKKKKKKRLPGEISTTSDMQMTPPLWQKVKRN